MRHLHKPLISKHRGAALIIVLAFVVLLTGLSVAYLSRTTSDRQVAHSSFNQSNVDQLVQSAVDNIIGDLRTEIANGSTPITDINGNIVGYIPKDTGSGPAANMVPQRSGNAAGAPNLIRRSVNPDNIPSPGIASRASAVNSQDNPSANGRFITSTRWNGHYLVPKKNTGPGQDDSTPIDAFTAATPDWVFVTSAGVTPIAAPTPSVIGRYSCAVYAEGGLLDMNVAGYPTDPSVAPIPAQRVGRKGSVAYADLTALGAYPIPNSSSPYQVDRLVGWRNYATTLPTNNFPNTSPAFAANFQTSSAPANAFYSYVLGNTNGFLSPSTATFNGRTDQMFLQRQGLIAFRQATQFSANALQYLGTYSRETNAPSYSPSTPPGSTIDYAGLATSTTAVNPNFLLRRAATAFRRFDGTNAVVGEPLVKTRFPLRRLAWITYKGPSASLATTDAVYVALLAALTNGGLDTATATTTIKAGTAANIQACFGLTFPVGGAAGAPWTYTNPNGVSAASRILRLDEVVAAGREPDFFELLQAGILSGSLGQNTGGGVTGQNNNTDGSGLVFPDIHMSNTTHHILSIGAAIIDQADPDSIPMRVQFSPDAVNVWTAYGVENLPYITQVYPIAGASPNDPTKWATYLLFQLWNPHQNTAVFGGALPAPVRLRVDGGIGIFTGGNGEKWNTGSAPTIVASGQSVTLNPSASLANPAPLTSLNTTGAAAAPGPASGGAFAVLAAPPVPTPTPTSTPTPTATP
jgi:hypothetical protein